MFFNHVCRCAKQSVNLDFNQPELILSVKKQLCSIVEEDFLKGLN